MKKLFSTPTDTLYTLATIIAMIMIMFPPSQFGKTLSFTGYTFIFDFYRFYIIDIGRLLLQFVALGAIVITIKRIIDKR